jgi:hypothetical protein
VAAGGSSASRSDRGLVGARESSRRGGERAGGVLGFFVAEVQDRTLVLSAALGPWQCNERQCGDLLIRTLP